LHFLANVLIPIDGGEGDTLKIARRIIPFMPDSEIIFSVQESPEGGYEAHALGYDTFTQGDTMQELREMVRDAVRCHFDESSAPAVIRLHMVKDEVISA
jgi:hypothetical protein